MVCAAARHETLSAGNRPQPTMSCPRDEATDLTQPDPTSGAVFGFSFFSRGNEKNAKRSEFLFRIRFECQTKYRRPSSVSSSKSSSPRKRRKTTSVRHSLPNATTCRYDYFHCYYYYTVTVTITFGLGSAAARSTTKHVIILFTVPVWIYGKSGVFRATATAVAGKVYLCIYIYIRTGVLLLRALFVSIKK